MADKKLESSVSAHLDRLRNHGEENNAVRDSAIEEAQAANVNEHNMTVRKALRSYPLAVFWSLAISMSIIVEGYDTNLIGSFYGIPWGIFATIGPAYSSELLPMALRSYLTAYTNMCFAIGQFISAGWIWPVLLLFIGVLMPESPWWQVRHGRYGDALVAVQRLTAGEEKTKARQTVAMMIHTNQIEQEIEAASSYWDCFRGSNLRRTEISCMSFTAQVLAGSQFAYTGSYFFEQAGMSPTDAYKLGLGGTAVAFVGTILSWFLMKEFGRRSMYLSGMGLMSSYHLIIGFLTWKSNNSVVWAQSALCIPLKCRPRDDALKQYASHATLTIAITVANVIEPYMMNPAAWKWRGKTGLFWFAFAFLTIFWDYFRLPETKGRTFEELDIMFAAGVPTRKLGKYHVDPYAENVAIKDRARESPLEKRTDTMSP
ncbi:MFS transporter sugar porter SP family protein [Aspergillus parasiticus SU-1]|uniref:MFS transporter sugar porter SP family protein n=1 Tax=Aspergillus parasiticus (strain ATCC 56775 / NRRL 5862 / SRRC 143 / SU-1) TaxID=1403190 RepID=A0A0F0I2H0_ASPPU|nr:MFS transporter sugar porter SP family protein [Aspergillus parasiticus SU-1]